MMTIAGYTLTAPVCVAGDLVLYRATRTLDGGAVLLKIPAASRPTPFVVRCLEREYELACDLDPSRVARPLSLEYQADNVVLVLEAGPIKTLSALLGSPMDIPTFLSVAIGITAALDEIHRHELIHKDIKPEHVLLDAAGHVWLTGLGIASRLPRERQVPEPPEVIAGTLAYMAPEQTGRMNRSIDSRSDLYALGVTFYQMLTGGLPFTAGDPMEWVHCHIARQPLTPNQLVASVPELLSGMVMKLMAKTAEERYQSTASLAGDLHQCLEEWESNGCIAPFPLGVHDVSERLLIPEKLYGRQSEIEPASLLVDMVEEPRVEPGGEDELAEPLIASPGEYLQELHRLALLGNMRCIVNYAEHIAGLNPSYQPFAAHLRKLAKGYQSKAILVFIEEHLLRHRSHDDELDSSPGYAGSSTIDPYQGEDI